MRKPPHIPSLPFRNNERNFGKSPGGVQRVHTAWKNEQYPHHESLHYAPPPLHQCELFPADALSQQTAPILKEEKNLSQQPPGFLEKMIGYLKQFGHSARENGYYLPAALGGALLLTILVLISELPALSLRSETNEQVTDAYISFEQAKYLSPTQTFGEEEALLTTLDGNSDQSVEVVQPGPNAPDAREFFGAKAERLAALQRQSETRSSLVEFNQSERTPIGDPQLIHRMGKVKFIAGMIATQRTKVSDCGTDCGRLAKDIVELSETHNVDPFFIAAMVSVESRFGTMERSKAGALGAMQLLPGTAREVLENRTGKKGNPVLTHSRTNITLGIEYIKELITKYRGNRFLALAAYNWGPGNVDSSLKRNGIPSSVRRYAEMVLQRAANWRRHFESAERSASSLAAASPVGGEAERTRSRSTAFRDILT